MTRTEDQKVTQAPFDVVLGPKTYKVKPLTILKAQAWRASLNAALGPIADSFQSTNGLVSQGLADALLRFPDKILQLLCEYSSEIGEDKDAVLLDATEEQLAAAFSDLMVVAYPFVTPLATVIRLIRPTTPKGA